MTYSAERIAAMRRARWGDRSADEMFWDRVDQSAGPGGCWLWLGPTDRDGYGRVGHGLAYRRAYEITLGPIPAGLNLDHLCRTKPCVNPAHLEPVTRAENARRQGVDRGGPRPICRNGHPRTRTPAGRLRCLLCQRTRHTVYMRARRRERAA